MKKILLILALVLSMLASFTAAYADTAVPYYIGTDSHRESFKISSTGTAEMLSLIHILCLLTGSCRRTYAQAGT